MPHRGKCVNTTVCRVQLKWWVCKELQRKEPEVTSGCEKKKTAGKERKTWAAKQNKKNFTHKHTHNFCSKHICQFLGPHPPWKHQHMICIISFNNARRLPSPHTFLHVDFSSSGHFHTGSLARIWEQSPGNCPFLNVGADQVDLKGAV